MNYELRNGAVIEDEYLSSILETLMELEPNLRPEYSWDDIGTATLMADIYSKDIRYCPQNGRWYLWDGCWRKQGDNVIIQDKLQTLLNLLRIYVGEISYVSPDDKRINDYAKYVSSIRTYNKMKNILEVFKTVPEIRLNMNSMDSDPYLMNTPAVAYNLRTGEKVPQERLHELGVTKQTSCNLPDFTTRRCDRWYRFIEEITGGNREKALFLQRALGYSLLGVNREECMFIAYGSKTRNGKGTLFSTVQTVLGSDYAYTAMPDLICESKTGKVTDFNAAQPALAKLVGIRLCIMSESSRDVRLDAASMKTMTGRDTLVTRDLYESSFSFVPQFTLWLNTNHLPAVTDDTVFTSDRIWVIEFNEHFDRESQDKDLKELFAAPENRPTILNWLYEGCIDYLKNGLRIPQCVLDATANYRKLHDRIGGFMEDCCEVDPDYKAQRGAVYSAYRMWCGRAENKYNPMGSTSFYNELATRGHAPKRTADGWYITGLKLREGTVTSDSTIKLK